MNLHLPSPSLSALRQAAPFCHFIWSQHSPQTFKPTHSLSRPLFGAYCLSNMPYIVVTSSPLPFFQGYVPFCVIYAQGSPSPCQPAGHIGETSLSVEACLDRLERAWLPLIAPRYTVHGTLIDLWGIGMLLTGKPAVGKSTAALALIERGHHLVADDAPYLSVSRGKLWGYSSPTIQGLLHTRDQGFLRLEKEKTRPLTPVKLELELCRAPISTRASAKKYLDISVKKYFLPVVSRTELIILIEDRIRNIDMKKSPICS